MSWPLVKLGGLVSHVSSGATPKGGSENYSDSGPVMFLRSQNIHMNELRLDDVIYINEDTHKKMKRSVVQYGDVLLNITGASIGRVAPFELKGVEVNSNQHVCTIRPIPEVLDYKYLSYFLGNRKFQEGIFSSQRGGTREALNYSQIRDFKIPLPPLEEQKRIAAILDKADTIRCKRQQAIKLADDFLRSVFLEMFGDPVTNPKGFPAGTIRDLVESANYGSSAKASNVEGDYPMLRMGNITYEGAIDLSDLKYIDLDEKDKNKYLVEKGDLLFNRTNSKELVGKTAIYDRDEPAAIAGYLIRVRANEKGKNYYISGYLNSAHGKTTLQNMCKSIVGMANINAQELQDISILIPPLELQKKYENLVLSIKEKLKVYEASLKYSSDLFNALSQKAFSGKL